jgi:flagellar biosynthesis/type III secretory pathway protein FliH
MQSFEETEKMRYVTSIERIALQEGIEQGIEQGVEQGIEQGSLKTAREAVLEILNLRFQPVPEDVIAAISNMTDLTHLKLLLRQAAIAGTLEEFERIV